MKPSLESLSKGHTFAATTFELTPEWVKSYIGSVEDGAIGALGGDAVPPMAVAALSIRALLEQAALPPGAVHLGQELRFQRPVSAGDSLVARASIISRGERQGWALLGIDLQVEDGAGRQVMTGRSTLTFPLLEGRS
jgi:acyl dehydratase